MGNIHDMQISCIFPFVMLRKQSYISGGFPKRLDKEEENEDLNQKWNRVQS